MQSIYMRIAIVFQSTLPRGERLGLSTMRDANGNFNPRSREGSDLLPKPFDLMSQEFQSTLPRGERQRRIEPPTSHLKFQSTLPRGERR